MSVNDKEIPILVIYYAKSKIICQQEFGSFSKFEKLLNFFNDNLKNNEFRLKEKYLLNNREIKKTDLLIDLIQAYDSSKKIINANFSIEIEEIKYIGDENFPIFTKILQPVRNKFGIYVFIPENGSISLEEYPENIENEYELEKFNISSSYCNSPNSLFISGGKYNGEQINNFWIIDNEFYSIKKLKMISPKSNHSMVHIKNNNKEIIFLVGGDDLSTFYYDIKNNIFVNWGNTNGIHFRPGLIHIGDYLYCFHLIQDEKNNIFFERTNLNDNNHAWEKIIPNFESEKFINNIVNNEFGLSHCAGGRIVLVGGNFNPNSFLYDINMNLFSYNHNYKNQLIPLIDKTFYKINQTHNIALPCSLIRHVEIAILNKLKYTFRKLYLRTNERNIKIKYKNIHNQDSTTGKVIVEFNTEDINEEQDNDKNNSIPIEDVNVPKRIYNEQKLPTMPNERQIINQQNKININGVKISHNNKENINKKNEEINFSSGIDDENIEINSNENGVFIDNEINNIQQDNNIMIDTDNNIVGENEKNADYMIPEKSDLENNKESVEIDEKPEEKNNINNNNQNNSSENEYEDAIDDIRIAKEEEFEENTDDNQNNYEQNFYEGNENYYEENMEEYNENNNFEEMGEGQEEEFNGEENEEEEGLERDKFELTIVQNIGEDIIQIENYPIYYFDENNFCDYDLTEKETGKKFY